MSDSNTGSLDSSEAIDVDLFRLEYENLTSDLARYENQGFGVISAFGFLVSATFAVGVRYSIEELFILIPLAGLTAIQMLISINYAYRIREGYLKHLEGIVGDGERSALRFYSSVHDTYLDSSNSNRILLPLHGFVGMGLILIAVLVVYGTLKGFWFLYTTRLVWSWMFLACIVGLFMYCCASFLWSVRRLRTQRHE